MEEFIIPFTGLRPGIHQYKFNIGEAFFQHFEHSTIIGGAIELHLDFDKNPDWFVLDFSFSGNAQVTCHRCLAPYEQRIEGKEQLLVKVTDSELEDEADVVYIKKIETHFNTAQYVYEFLTLHLPARLVHPEDPTGATGCDPRILQYISNAIPNRDESNANPIWDALKDLNQQ